MTEVTKTVSYPNIGLLPCKSVPPVTNVSCRIDAMASYSDSKINDSIVKQAREL